MTLAVCFICGASKIGAWTPCPVCGANPATDEEMATSLALTDHYLTPEGLAQVQQRIAAGQPLDIPADFYAQLLQTIQAERLRPPWWKFWRRAS